MLLRRPDQARFDVEIRGITREVTMTDFLSRNSGDSNDESNKYDNRLDSAEYKLIKRNDKMSDPTEALDELDDLDRLGAIAERESRSNEIADDSIEKVIAQRMEFLTEAVTTLTDKQAVALWLWAIGYSEIEAANYLGISQPTYHETIHGKEGVGGVLRKIFKYLAKHPIG